MFPILNSLNSLNSLKSLFTLLSRSAQRDVANDADEAYLAEAVDIYDLERRMRALDDRMRGPWAGGIRLGLYPR